MKKRILLTSFLTIALCFSLLTAATFALFTDEDQVNIAVTSGDVDYEAKVEELTLFSPALLSPTGEVLDGTNAATDTVFANGGTAELNGKVLTLTNMTPGDEVSFKVVITNNSNVTSKYQTVLSAVEDSKLTEVLEVSINNTKYSGASIESDWTTLAAGVNPDAVEVSVKLPVSAGNEYKNLTVKFDVTVSAVQGNVAGTVTVKNQEELNDLIKNSNEPVVVNLPAGDYKVPALSGKNVTFVGNKDAVIDATAAIATGNSTLAFEGVTLNYDNDAYEGFQHTKKVTFTDCTFTGTQFLYTDTDYVNCTFNMHDDTTEYSVWTYGAKNVNFTGCTFNTNGKAVLIYNEDTDSNFVANVSFDDCKFYSNGKVDTEKAAVETGSNANNTATSNKYNIKLDNCEVYGFGVSPKGIVTNSTVWSNKNSMDADHLKVELNNVKEYKYTATDSQEDLNDAITSAGTEETVIALPKGDVALNGNMANKDLVFTGTKDTEIDVTTNFPSTNGATLGFEGVTVNYDNDNYEGFTHAKKVVYNDCVINGKQFLYAEEVEFNNCTLVNINDYSVWTYGAKKVTFNNCTFVSGGKAVLVYIEDEHHATVVFNSCTFNSDGSLANDKAAVEVGASAHSSDTTYDIQLNDCNITGFYANNSTSTLWGNKNSMDTDHLNVVIDGVDVY